MNASIRIVGFIGWPVCALLMFLSLPNSPVSQFISWRHEPGRRRERFVIKNGQSDEPSSKTDWPTMLFLVVALSTALIYGGIWIGLVTFAVGMILSTNEK